MGAQADIPKSQMAESIYVQVAVGVRVREHVEAWR
jgi:hypothetical protein